MELKIPNVILTGRGLYEDVCDLNGIAIPSIYYDHIFRYYFEKNANASSTESQPINVGASVLKQVIDDCMRETKDHEYRHLKQLIAEFPDECDTISDYLRLSNLFVAAKERLLFKLKQIDDSDYTWLTEDAVEECLRRLDDVIGAECELELPLVEHNIIQKDMEAELERVNQILLPYFSRGTYGQGASGAEAARHPNGALAVGSPTRKFRFTARADLITKKCIWELKCTSSISIEHRLQVVLYDWLWRIVNTPDIAVKRRAECVSPKETRIINIKSGEILRLNASFEDLTTIVVELLKGKYEQIPQRTTEEFIADCANYITQQTQK
jgi:hypothetical protein